MVSVQDYGQCAGPKESSGLSRLLGWMDAIKGWMTDNFLQLNNDKTEVLIFAPDNVAPDISQHIGPYSAFAWPSQPSQV